MGSDRSLVKTWVVLLVAGWLMAFGLAALGQPAVPPAKAPAAPAKAPAASVPAPAAPAAAPAPVRPEKMDPKALTYPKAVIQQEIEVGKAAVVPLLTQFLTQGKAASPALDSEAVKKSMASVTRFLVVSMVPGPEAGGMLDAENAAAHYGALFAQFNWISLLRTVKPQDHMSFHWLVDPDGKGLFFVTAEPTRILATLAVSDADLSPLLEVLAPTFGAGVMPSALTKLPAPTPGPSSPSSPSTPSSPSGAPSS